MEQTGFQKMNGMNATDEQTSKPNLNLHYTLS